VPTASTSSTPPATDPPRPLVWQILTWWKSPVEDPALRAGPKIPGEERDRRSRAKSGTEGFGRRAGPKVSDEERKGTQARTAGHGRRLGIRCEGIKEKLK